jgi:hypothetical protein
VRDREIPVNAVPVKQGARAGHAHQSKVDDEKGDNRHQDEYCEKSEHGRAKSSREERKAERRNEEGMRSDRVSMNDDDDEVLWSR